MLVQLFLKRAFDIGFTLVASTAILPLAFAVAVLIRLTSRGPVFYRATRIGKHGRPFLLYKFRTMVHNAHALGPPLTHRNDPRVTSIGRILRRTKFDEFPQVMNVLRGQMSIVGPRPEAPEYVSCYSLEQRAVLRVRPGLTSLAQVFYRDEEAVLPANDTEGYYVGTVLPRKLELDLYYVRHWSCLLDAKIFLLGLLALARVPLPAVMWPLKAKGVPNQVASDLAE